MKREFAIDDASCQCNYRQIASLAPFPSWHLTKIFNLQQYNFHITAYFVIALNMSNFIPGNYDLWSALILCYHLKETATELYRMVIDHRVQIKKKNWKIRKKLPPSVVVPKFGKILQRTGYKLQRQLIPERMILYYWQEFFFLMVPILTTLCNLYTIKNDFLGNSSEASSFPTFYNKPFWFESHCELL